MDANYIGYIVSGCIILIAIIIAVVAQIKVSSTYEEFSQVAAKSGITGYDLANNILQATGNQAELRVIKGHLNDNYNPLNKTVNISKENAMSNSIAALGVVAHEMGHYLQHTKKYKPFYIRQFVVKACNFASGLLLPLLMVGIFMNLFWVTGGIVGDIFIWIAVALYGVSALANLATLPVEINASRRAQKILSGMNVLDKEELFGTRKVLGAAALTYVASLLISLGYFLRFLFYALIIRDN